MDDNTLLRDFAIDEVIRLHMLKRRLANSGRLVSDWARENTRCLMCRVKTYDEDMQFGLCGSCVEEFQEAGRWCGQHGPLPVRVRWINRLRNEYELIVLPCPSCPVEGVA